ncbi:MAG: hypothetical protein A3I77_03645 [Gammaproteobacteria bacterium RIFCSPLOWO2_02_FULL_42_14]|nr:MAG: hypothetical protein A3B71_04950 [Gammaproteobacteria bacterium RIFCSPHIGHO2_02_FULL_42_43]OGT51352.1 MAG: hypothetical protein A3E54_04715 [Gammaproteobacteria bacterium RIFCSPHIGHO2_12_FULL_41_25]OGT62054.1 MAG: hypothetical protein A3I77_03645 [Gammaproteobacteria bacterium RIFCSPLOWO2_02_FULL_42_14]OGT85727.1 MAG: hypothetical protein A3G86_03340 [Gammaproteobacteria bacterium RIFCSPLOWO2_12_FULL_42_18]
MKTILNTRSETQSHELSSLLEFHGNRVIHFPLLKIIPIDFDSVESRAFDYFIFTSQNAVEQFFLRVHPFPKHAVVIAVGSATRNALENKGVKECIVPEKFSSVGILALPILQHIQERKIAIVSGENPKLLLSDALEKRAAQVTPIYCYRRVAMSYDMGVEFPRLQSAAIDTIILTSDENMTQCLQLFSGPTHRSWLLQKAVCVISEEMENRAKREGFQTVMLADNATNAAIARKMKI